MASDVPHRRCELPLIHRGSIVSIQSSTLQVEQERFLFLS